MPIEFEITHQDGGARTGRLFLGHGRTMTTPMFMPVGTLGVVKTLTQEDLLDLDVRMILCNAYHLYLRPGAALIESLGGLHAFMNWPGGIIADSGGFQVFSLAHFRKIGPNGVEFTSHLDGSKHHFTPESNVGLQHQLGADIIMPLDVCPPFPASASELEQAVEFTSAWARKAQQEHFRLRGDQTLFAINQGGINKAAREKSLKDLLELDFQGYAIGGLSVGEGIEAMTETLAFLNPLLPESKPRYLMGVGTPLDLWAAFEHGVDMLDCAMPTRIARNGTLFTSQGRLNIKNARYAKDTGAPDPECGCLLCQSYSRAYLRHLLLMGEITALRLCTLHNLTFMLDLCRQIQVAIEEHRFVEAKKEFLKKYIKEK